MKFMSKIWILAIASLSAFLFACDDSKKQEEPSKVAPQDKTKEEHAFRNYVSQMSGMKSRSRSKSLNYDIAQADSMAVISCYPEEPTPLLTPKKNSREDTVVKTPIPFKGKKLGKRKIGIPKLTTYVVFASNNKKDIEELSEAVSVASSENRGGFDRQWSTYYVELFKKGAFISGTSLYTELTKGYYKDGFTFYFENVEKVRDYFRTRNVYPMPRGCSAGLKKMNKDN